MSVVHAPKLVELASGVDSLYISGRSWIPELLVRDLDEARATARETRLPVDLSIGGDLFGVSGSGLNRYSYRLQHRHGLIGLTTSDSLPTVTVQPNASLIHAVGVRSAIEWFVEVVELLLGRVEWKASRIDLFMDSHGWDLVASDRDAFVCRAKQRVMYEDDSTLRTLMFGTAKSGVKARIYDKTEESRKKGTDWWPSVWGDAYMPGERVLRVEFQVGREVLKQSQIDTPVDALDRMPELWGYLTDRWLTLRSPGADETRSRWPVASEWQDVQQASLRGTAVGLERVAAGAQAGSMRRLLPQLRGYLASAGAILGAESLEETMHRVGRRLALDELETGLSFAGRLREKRLAVVA
jgi:hypothetical protein